MEAKKETIQTVTFKGTEVDDFRSIIEKLKKEESKIGFNKLLSESEKKLLDEIKTQIE